MKDSNSCKIRKQVEFHGVINFLRLKKQSHIKIYCDVSKTYGSNVKSHQAAVNGIKSSKTVSKMSPTSTVLADHRNP